MSQPPVSSPDAGAQHVVSRLMRESLMDKRVLAGTEAPVRRILPHLNVIQIGGLSIMDRGQSAVLPLLDEIVANQAEHTQVIGVGPGVRARHILSVGLDLGLPTGALATLAAKSSAQNAYMVSCLLASHGFVYLEAPFIVQLLPLGDPKNSAPGFSTCSLVRHVLTVMPLPMASIILALAASGRPFALIDLKVILVSQRWK